MSTPSYTGNSGHGIFPLPNPSDPGCFRFTDKTTTGCERNLYQQYWQEQIQLYGQQVTYYVNNYNTLSADNFYGEQPTQRFSLPQTIIMAVNLNENALLMSKYGLMSDDEITAFVPYSSFYAQFGAGVEPKADDVFGLTEYGSDRVGGRGPNYYVITQRLDQDIAQINTLMGHYVWMIKAKRFEFSFEPGAPQEQANQQVYEDIIPTSTTGINIDGASKPYQSDANADVQNNVFDYTQNGNDSVYGGYIGTQLGTYPDIITPTGIPLNLGGPTTGTYTTGQLYIDLAGALFRYMVNTWVQVQPAVVTATPSPGPNGIIPINYLISMPNQNWAQFYYDGTTWQPVNLQPTQ